MSNMNETNRIEAFSDGVFAIAITLLVLDLRPPEHSEHGAPLGTQLLHQWPNYVAFLTSFAFIGIMWINHHRLFNLIRRSDDTLLILNGLLLLGVTLLPFPSALLAAYIHQPGDRIAAIVYDSTFIFIAFCFNALWRYASHKNRLLDPRANPDTINNIHKAFAYGPLVYIVNTVIAFFSVDATLIVNAALAIFYALPPKHATKHIPEVKHPTISE